jgi:PIN domain nuclease of toxin-antitoxin system
VVSCQSNAIFVSAVSAYEIANKVRRGKLPEAEMLSQNFVSTVTDAGFRILSLETEVALLAGRFIGEHRDPWDRMIARSSSHS